MAQRPGKATRAQAAKSAARVVSCAIISGQRLLLDLLGDMLRLRRGLRVMNIAVADVLTFVTDTRDPLDIIVVDCTVLDDDGHAAVIALASRHPDTLLIAVTPAGDGVRPPDGIADRCQAIVGMHQPLATFLAALEDACAGRIPTPAPRKSRSRRHESLTAREAEIFALLGEGLTTAEIATMLSRSYFTIQTHRKRIIEKLGRLGSPLSRRAATHRDASLRGRRGTV